MCSSDPIPPSRLPATPVPSHPRLPHRRRLSLPKLTRRRAAHRPPRPRPTSSLSNPTRHRAAHRLSLPPPRLVPPKPYPPPRRPPTAAAPAPPRPSLPPTRKRGTPRAATPPGAAPLLCVGNRWPASVEQGGDGGSRGGRSWGRSGACTPPSWLLWSSTGIRRRPREERRVLAGGGAGSHGASAPAT